MSLACSKSLIKSPGTCAGMLMLVCVAAVVVNAFHICVGDESK